MNHYRLLANLFKYPTDQLLTDCENVGSVIREKYPDEVSKYNLFQVHIQDNPLNSLQEYYVKTFDIQALCQLDVGYILFGEDLKRGDFLVKLQAEHKKYNNDLGTELPDHLPNVLNLLAITDDKEFADEFVQFILLPAIMGMLKGFKSDSNVYFTLLEMLKQILIRDFNIEEINIKIPAESKDCAFAGNGCSINNSDNY